MATSTVDSWRIASNPHAFLLSFGKSLLNNQHCVTQSILALSFIQSHDKEAAEGRTSIGIGADIKQPCAQDSLIFI
jgi:hypothetical protein